MKQTTIRSAIALVLGSAGVTAQAALTTSAVLEFDAGVRTCVIGGTYPDCTYLVSEIASGSYFAVDTNDNGVDDYDKKAISMHDGIHIGTLQDASGSHAGAPNGSESPGIDNAWLYYQTGMHQTTSPITVASDNGASKELDFSGWGWDYFKLQVDLGGGQQDCGTTNDGICVDTYGNDIGGQYDNGTGLATITCSTASCSVSSTFTLDYAAVFPQTDLSGFGGSLYVLHLEGQVGVVPIPAAAWLFGSGLAGLMAVARRRKARA